jgi:hypothetical protein
MPVILGMLEKYEDVPMSVADACLVRLAKLLANPLLLTTDADFKIYRRMERKVVPCLCRKSGDLRIVQLPAYEY